ncbi:MAG: alanine--glyoxylate aminotransferase family protein [Nitrospira sp.]|nr:alanine--glyoxylate aminotransferase family protein [Candidatus Manganitrophaceae bacterium]HIL35460.1 alanine--glyoxylate aminotransferase family protein [Candidatus Manganitrophaceae bacterium]
MKRYLLAPGPTNVSSEVLLAMAQPILHHRSPEFSKLLERVKNDLKWLFQTENDVFILASTGTGGMEGAVSNFLSPGDKALVVNGGKFGERWLKICAGYGVKTEEIKVEWGYAVKPEQIREALQRDPSIKGVFTQGSETSTGVAHPIKEIAAVVREFDECLMVVDAVSAMGVFDIQTDAWGLDVVVTGSQKALALPPGLAFVSVSEKGWCQAEKCTNAKFYFNFKKERESIVKNTTAFTAPVSLIVGLERSLQMFKEEGLENVFARHQLLARATGEAMKGIGMSLFPKESPSTAVTAIVAPEGYDGQQIYKDLRVKYGITAAGGQDQLKGKVFRIANIGYLDTFDAIMAVAAIEMVLKGMGHPLKLGTGVGIAQEILLKK